jgi:hypothetical protein
MFLLYTVQAINVYVDTTRLTLFQPIPVNSSVAIDFSGLGGRLALPRLRFKGGE